MKYTKYAITGHTSGIGCALYDFLSPNCAGFSRSNGYDISNFNKILEDSYNHQIFINNAYEDFYQSKLLLAYFHKFKFENKIIINVGSSAADPKKIFKEDNALEYQMHKKSLKILCEDLQEVIKFKKYNLKVLYVSFGYVGTTRILKKYPELTTYISEEEAVRIILKDVFSTN